MNSNPSIINLVIRWLTESLGLKKENLKLLIYIYPDSNQEAVSEFWSNYTGIPRNQFLKTTIDTRTDKKAKKAGKLPYGTAHLRVNSLGEKKFGVFLARKIMAWSDIVLAA